MHEHIESDLECSSVSGYFNTYTLNVENSNDYDIILNETCIAAESKLIEYLSKHPIKSQIIITLMFYKNTPEGNKEQSEKTFRSFCEPLLAGDDIEQFFLRAKETIRIAIE